MHVAKLQGVKQTLPPIVIVFFTHFVQYEIVGCMYIDNKAVYISGTCTCVRVWRAHVCSCVSE